MESRAHFGIKICDLLGKFRFVCGSTYRIRGAQRLKPEFPECTLASDLQWRPFPGVP